MLILLFLVLLTQTQILASDVPIKLTEPPCDSDPEWIQPIAINLGLDTITAAYAYSDTNTSILTNFGIYDPSLNLTIYANTIKHLRKQHMKNYKDRPTAPQTRLQYGVKVAKYYLREFREVTGLFWELASRSWTEVILPGLDESRELYWYPIWLWAHVVTYEYMQLTRFIDFAAKRISWAEEELSLKYIEDGFAQALKAAKAIAYNNTGINITSAMIIYPDFFNTAVQRRVHDATYYASMQTLALGTYTKRQLFENYGNELLLNKTKPPVPKTYHEQVQYWLDNQLNLILLDQGATHFDLLTSGKHCMMNHPMDHMQCESILQLLWFKLRDRNEAVDQNMRATRSVARVRKEMIAARESMKRQQWREEYEASEHVKEWPMDLDDWWSSEEKRQPVSLLWEDVEAVNEQYVNLLAESLDQVQLCLQGREQQKRPTRPHQSPSTELS
ncbi:hypothetical protein BDV12DRAFT_64487 [Aspergillus spectabilis]